MAIAKQCICPHCGARMNAIETPWESSWGGEIHYVCFNDDCMYFCRSWETLESQGVENTGYRCRIDPRGEVGAIPVWSMDALRNRIIEEALVEKGTIDLFEPGDFVPDETAPDVEYWSSNEPEFHVDALALSTIEDLYLRVIPKGATILDLAAGTDSHLRPEISPAAVTGLGLNSEALDRNPVLSARVIHNLNSMDPLPFEDNSFDTIICTISIEYFTSPLELFREAARVLKPQGMLVVTFSNRMFPPKAAPIWKKTPEADRIELVQKYFSLSGRFYVAGKFESTGQPRPADDKYYPLGLPSDPIYAVWGTVLP